MLVQAPRAGLEASYPRRLQGGRSVGASFFTRGCITSIRSSLLWTDRFDGQGMTMHFLSTRFRYGTVAQLIHWLTAILFVAAYFMGPGGSEQHVYSSAV